MEDVKEILTGEMVAQENTVCINSTDNEKIYIDKGFSERETSRPFIVFKDLENQHKLLFTKKQKGVGHPVVYWIASLSNGVTIFEDCIKIKDKKIIQEPAWIRLKKFCEKYNLSITRLRFQGFYVTHVFPPDYDGLFVAKKHVMIIPGGTSYDSHIVIGIIKKDTVLATMFNTSCREIEYEIRGIETINNALVIWKSNQ